MSITSLTIALAFACILLALLVWRYARRANQLKLLTRLMGLQGERLKNALQIAIAAENHRRECERDKSSYAADYHSGPAAISGINYALSKEWMASRAKVEALTQTPPDQNIHCDPELCT